jgi:cytochrome c oxidase cbb3-type subunit 3
VRHNEMKISIKLLAAAMILTTWTGIHGQGQRGAAGARGARGGGNPNATFPAQQRPPGDPDLIARGNALYGIHCRACHGVDLRGGDQGGPNLLRSQLVLNDQAGELILPVVRDGLRNPGAAAMPALGLAADDIRAIAEYIHSVVATSRGQGAPPPGPPVTLNVLVGDANAGRTYFASKCAGCHSADGDLKGIGARVPDSAQLQNTWVAGARGAGGRGGGAARVTATVTLPSGQRIEGRLARIDDFIVVLTLEDGSSRSFRRDGDIPKIDIQDPREPHRKLLPTYTDKEIHDLTAYLVTLK